MRWSQKCTCFSWTLPLTWVFPPQELLTDRQTVETPAIVSGSWRGKSRGPALFFHPGASYSPSVHVESSTSRPGPTRCLTPYSLDKPWDDSTPTLALWLHLLTDRCATDRMRGNSPLLFLYLETNEVLFWSLRVVFYFLVIYYGARRGFMVLLRGEEQRTPNMGISCY